MNTFAPAEPLLDQLSDLLPFGATQAMRGAELAGLLGISERTVRALVDELIDRGVLVGSVCSSATPGYFLIDSEEDLELGTRHLVARARSLHVRVARLRREASTRFGEPTALRLFDLDAGGGST